MPSAKGSAVGRGRAGSTAGDDAPVDVDALAAFFTDLARRVRQDASFARDVADALRRSGLLDASAEAGEGRSGATASGRTSRRTETRGGRGDRAATAQPAPEARAAGALIDPFAVLRSGGEAALREALAPCESGDLQRIIRAHRLDPARISARWSAHDRLLNLIVDQVRARANHGRAFERV